MIAAQRAGVIACLASGLLLSTAASAQSAPVQDQIAQQEQLLAQARAAGKVSDEGFELISLGFLYRQAGDMQKALACLNEALPIEQKANNEAAQAMTKNNMGRVYSDLGQEDEGAGAVQRGVGHVAQAGDTAGRSEHADQHGQGL